VLGQAFAIRRSELDEAIRHRRFDGTPGMTGLWQVSGRNERSYEDMVRLDIEYLNRPSWLFDLWLLERTVNVVFGGRGAV
jgi:lipopolysaccharide/colanic/teichoic acid biosynthesis glycosyltransferase